MRPILFGVWGLNFYAYGFFTALGLLAAGFVINYLARKKRLITKKRQYFLIDGLLLSLLAGIMAARIGYIVLYNFILDLESLATGNLISGGFIFYVGLLVGLIVFRFWVKREEANSLPWFDVLMVGLMVAMGFSEIGGYLNDGLVVHLAGMVGSFALAGLFYVRLATERRAGQTFWPGLFLMFLLFFFLGFWKTEKILLVGLNLTQWASLAAMLSLSYLAGRSLTRDDKSS